MTVKSLGAGLLAPVLPVVAVVLVLRLLGMAVSSSVLAALTGMYGILGGATVAYLRDGSGCLSAVLFLLVAITGFLFGFADNIARNAWSENILLGYPLRNAVGTLCLGAALGALYGAEKSRSRSD